MEAIKKHFNAKAAKGTEKETEKVTMSPWFFSLIEGFPYTTYKVNSESDLVTFWGSFEKGFNKMGLNNTECCNTTL